MSAFLKLHSRCQTFLAPPMNFKGPYTLDDAKIPEALTPLWECLNVDDSEAGFLKWIMLPLVIVFGEDGALSIEGKKIFAEANLSNRVKMIGDAYKAEKQAYLESKKHAELEDKWEFAMFANRDIARVGTAFQFALRYTKTPQQ